MEAEKDGLSSSVGGGEGEREEAQGGVNLCVEDRRGREGGGIGADTKCHSQFGRKNKQQQQQQRAAAVARARERASEREREE